MTRHALIASSALAVLLTGCASVSPDGLRSEVAQHVASRLPTGTALPQRPVLATHADASASADAAPASAAPTPIDTWLAQPLDADTAVRIAVLNNPSVHVQLAQLVAQDAARAQALTLINPSLTLGRFTRAGEREIEREIGFKLVSLITWPWRARWQGWQLEQHTLNTAQAVLRQAAQARRDWLNAVAARQSLKAAEHLHQAAAAGGELSRRMAAVGNFSQQQHARELQSQQAAAAQLARARLAAQLAHEALARTLGLWGAQAAALTLPEQLPALPKADQLMAGEAAEATALRERLDLRALRRDLDATAERSGVARVGALLGDIGLSHRHNSSQDRATGGSTHTRGWELNLPLPVFDWGGAASASARAELDRSAAQLRETALAARSEARSSWLRYRTAWDLAQQQRTEVLPTAQLLQDEAVLRYNGMFISVWDLLAQARATTQAVATATEAERDFWLAEVDLQLAVLGASRSWGQLAGQAGAQAAQIGQMPSAAAPTAFKGAAQDEASTPLLTPNIQRQMGHTSSMPPTSPTSPMPSTHAHPSH